MCETDPCDECDADDYDCNECCYNPLDDPMTTYEPESIAKQICSVQPMQLDAHFDDETLSWSVTTTGDDMRHLGSFSVTVSKFELLQTLRKNRELHIEEYEEAFRGFENLCVKKLRKRASAISNGKCEYKPRYWMSFQMTPPINHEREYTQLIEMLEMAEEDSFKIDGSQFRQWVQDEWEWRDEFENTKALYNSHS